MEGASLLFTRVFLSFLDLAGQSNQNGKMGREPLAIGGRIIFEA